VTRLFRFTSPVVHRMTREFGTKNIRSVLYGLLIATIAVFALPCFAQYSANVQGTVLDPAGAAVSGAHLQLVNLSTGQVKSQVTDATGTYHFVSLAPGDYRLDAVATGFSKSAVSFKLDTDQTLAVPVSFVVASANATVTVNGAPPVLDTADTRNEMTIEQASVNSLPLEGRSMISLVTMAPGVSGLGIIAGGTPGSGPDNFSTETQVDSSANGQGAVGNMYIVDGLDVSSAIRPGVLNLTPNPDSIQEVSVQVNTYNVDYGRASSVQMAMTTKSGSDKFHGSASDYYQNQSFWAATEFRTKQEAGKYLANNMSGTIGGPIWPLHQAFFFFSIEPLREVQPGGGDNVFEDPALVTWAKTAYPNTVGTGLLTNYPAKVFSSTPNQTMAQAGLGAYCGGAGELACDATATDRGTWAGTSPRNGMQWNARLDKNFTNDRLYGDIYRGKLVTGTASMRPAFSWTANTFMLAWQGNWAHTFSPNTLNEAIVGGMRVEGIQESGGDDSVPSVNVTGLDGTGGNGAFGEGFAQGDFIQHNYHWRDVLTHIKGNHTMKFGYEGWTGDDVEEFQGPHDLPSFQFNNIGDLIAADTSNPTAVQPYSEGGVAYYPTTGLHEEWDWNAASRTGGLFLQDTWKVRKNVTINYGIRWDDFGNPYSRTANTAFGNFYPGPGTTYTQQVANGSVIEHNHALARSITDVLSPRGGVAWDMFGNSQWVLHGGSGIFHNWPTPANVQEEMRGNPPGGIYPNFYGSDPNLAHRPIFGLGTSNTPPFGFTYPTLAPTPLNAQGGLTGLVIPIGSVDPYLKTPVAYIYSATLEHPLTHTFVASVGYSGAIGHSLLSGGGNPNNVSYGVDINAMPNDPGVLAGTTPVRYNQSFGTIYNTSNAAHSAYNAFIADVHGQFAGTGFVDVSYTRSASKDNSENYPVNNDPQQYYGPSNWDVPNRLSATFSYELRGFNQGQGPVGHITGGWGVSGTVVSQSGYPFSVDAYSSYNVTGYGGAGALCGAGLAAQNPCGDYNADGDNFDAPDVASYAEPHTRKDFLPVGIAGGKGGVFRGSTAFTQPAVGTEGNEKENLFRNPGFFGTNASIHKTTQIREDIAAEFRFEIFNLFNHPNLQGVDTNVNDGGFGEVFGQNEPRWFQLGANIKF